VEAVRVALEELEAVEIVAQVALELLITTPQAHLKIMAVEGAVADTTREELILEQQAVAVVQVRRNLILMQALMQLQTLAVEVEVARLVLLEVMVETAEVA
jgi:hypothetical protein